MPQHAFIGLLIAFLLASRLWSQPDQATRQGTRSAAPPEEQQAIYFQEAQSLRSTDPKQAAAAVQKALQLSVEIKDRRKEAESAWLGADLAEKAGNLPTAILLYAQAKSAAQAALLPEMPLQAVEKLQNIAAKQGKYQAAYDWGKEYTTLVQEKSRRYAEGQDRLHEAAQAALVAQKKRENNIVLAALLGLVAVMLFFYYARQRANRRIRGEMAEKNAMIEEKRRRSEQLLLNILPRAVAAELTVRNKVAAQRYEHATVMFIDFVGFTQIAEQLAPEVLIAELDHCFSCFDELIGRNRIEKIKTVGDAYICASGLSDRNESPADMIKAALQIQQFLLQLQEKRRLEQKPFFRARIGIHFGPVVAGVVGTKKFAYDIWGDTVNTAARMEQACEAGQVNVSGAARAVVQDVFQWEYRGKIAAKNKGELEMYYAY